MSTTPERKSKPPTHRDDAAAVLKRLRDSGHVAYFAGGCVRDMLLGLQPSDFDVATDAPPDRVRELFSSTQAVGAKFGVILVRHRTSVVEVATFRREGAYLDGRRPSEVRFTTAEEDAQRRDFTINGMFYDPITDQVVDFVGGQKDLANRVLRAIGEPDARFREDHLRLMRAIRFAARFNLTIEPATAEAITKHSTHLKAISPERIAEELRLMITPLSRIEAFRLLRQFGLLDVILRFFPESASSVTGDAPGLFPAISPPLCNGPISFGLALAAISLEHRLRASGDFDPLRFLVDAEVKRATRAVRQALRISNEEQDEMHGAMSVAHLLRDSPPGVAAMKRFLAKPTSGDARLLMAAMARCGMIPERIQTILADLESLSKTEFAPPPFVTGDDLVSLGVSPGPAYRRILDQLYDAQLENRIGSREAALILARDIAKV